MKGKATLPGTYIRKDLAHLKCGKVATKGNTDAKRGWLPCLFETVPKGGLPFQDALHDPGTGNLGLSVTRLVLRKHGDGSNFDPRKLRTPFVRSSPQRVGT